METERKADLGRGMRLLPDLREVTPELADERSGGIYREIQATLRVPFVSFLFRVLANYPDWLDSAWHGIRALARTRAFEEAADDLRSGALLEPVPEAGDVNWQRLGELGLIRPFTDTIHYVLPKLLLITTAWDEDMTGSALRQRSRSPTLSAKALAGIPTGPAPGAANIELVDPLLATGRLRQLFDGIELRHGHPGVASYYRALGNWPEFLEAVWQRIEPRVAAPDYEEQGRLLVVRARLTMAALRPGGEPIAVETGLGEEERRDVQSILAVFRLRLIPDMMLDIALIKAMLDGADAARSSRLSAAA